MEPLLIVAAAGLGLIAVLALKARSKKNTIHSSAQMLRFANSAAAEVLSSNWNHDDYYACMYKYASPELASHMYKNKALLNKVLDERAELLGSYIDLKDLELRGTGFNLWPSHVHEVAGVLHCSKARVPVLILVNAAQESLSLDGIKVMKKEAKISKVE